MCLEIVLLDMDKKRELLSRYVAFPLVSAVEELCLDESLKARIHRGCFIHQRLGQFARSDVAHKNNLLRVRRGSIHCKNKEESNFLGSIPHILSSHMALHSKKRRCMSLQLDPPPTSPGLLFSSFKDWHIIHDWIWS